ncbi:MAG: putative nucleic acid-binding Zn-ribbon protein [Roseivirga sp.]|jgi:predicted  nucleic acid-binding Zn-ribbon protein
MRTKAFIILLLSTSLMLGQDRKDAVTDSLSAELQYLEKQIDKFSDLLEAKVEALEKVDVEKGLKQSRKKIEASLERINNYRKDLVEDRPALTEKQKELLSESAAAMRESMNTLGAALEIWTAQIAQGWLDLTED